MEEQALNVTYQDMLDMLTDLDEEFTGYDSRVKEIKRASNQEQSRILEEHTRKKRELNNTANAAKEAAKKRHEDWEKKISDYGNLMERTHEQIRKSLSCAATVAITAGMVEQQDISEENSVAMLQQESQMLQQKQLRDDNASLLKMHSGGQTIYSKLQNGLHDLRQAAQLQYNREVECSESAYAQACMQNDTKKQNLLEQCHDQQTKKLVRAQENLQENVTDELRPEKKAEQYAQLRKTIVDGNVFQPAQQFPDGICFGYASYDAQEHFSDPVRATILDNQFQFAMEHTDTERSLIVPYGHCFKDSKFSTLLIYDTSERDKTIEVLRNMVLQIFMAIPCGKARFTFIDPTGLGNTFAVFSSLGGVDERIIDTRFWIDETRIEERLQIVVDHTEDVILRCLKGRFEDIVDYNHSAGKNSEPMRFVVAMDFPKHFSQKSLDYLESIVSKGPQNGVFTILAIDAADLQSPDCPPTIQKIASQMNQIRLGADGMYTDCQIGGKPLGYRPLPSLTQEKLEECIDTLCRGIKESERIIITYDDVSDNLLQKPDYWFHYDARNGISIPIGLEGANQPVMLQLGGVNAGGKKRPFHAMVTGTIGSGKSSMLHTIITGLLLHYNPEDVQLYILDFKRGIEFKGYADAGLKNFRVIAIDTEEEFGLAVLKSLVEEEKRRSSRFREEKVDRIEAYRERMAQKGIIHHDMPRLVVVFDEYQELFKEADDPVARECSRILSQVVLQAGSAMGIHMILATQDISNVKGLDPALYAQFETRIVLKCSEASSKIVLSPDNEASAQLVGADAGQAVFNDAVGHKDYNHFFRSAFIDQEERPKLLARIQKKQQELSDLQMRPARLLLSSVQDDASGVLNLFSTQGLVDDDPTPASRLFIGEGLMMVNNFQLKLWVREEQNLLLIGRNQDKASKACGFAAMSLLYETIRQEGAITRPMITVFNFEGRNAIENNSFLKQICEAVPEAFDVVDSENIVNALQILRDRLEENERHYVIFFGLNRARRLLQATTRYDQLPREVFVDLLRRGPENGMHFIVWANDPALYLNDYGDTLDLFEYRMGFDMEPEEYEATISHIVRQSKDGQPKTEGSLSAIAFDINDENQKVRLYDTPTSEWTAQFIENCRKYIQ